MKMYMRRPLLVLSSLLLSAASLTASCHTANPKIASDPNTFKLRVDSHDSAEVWRGIYNLRVDVSPILWPPVILLSAELHSGHGLQGFFEIRTEIDGSVAKHAMWRIAPGDRRFLAAVEVADLHTPVHEARFVVGYLMELSDESIPAFTITATNHRAEQPAGGAGADSAPQP